MTDFPIRSPTAATTIAAVPFAPHSQSSGAPHRYKRHGTSTHPRHAAAQTASPTSASPTSVAHTASPTSVAARWQAPHLHCRRQTRVPTAVAAIQPQAPQPPRQLLQSGGVPAASPMAIAENTTSAEHNVRRRKRRKPHGRRRTRRKPHGRRRKTAASPTARETAESPTAVAAIQADDATAASHGNSREPNGRRCRDRREPHSR